MLINQISYSLNLDSQFVAKIARSASYRYRTYFIDKRTGGRREINQPSVELKLLQRWLVDNIFSFLPVHDSVFSYRKNVGVRRIAEKHRRSHFLLRIDLENFFPSIRDRDIRILLEKNLASIPLTLKPQDVGVICKLVCREQKLTIGAPSSPSISNAILFPLDTYCSKTCSKDGVIYTRYADDLYFSSQSPNILPNLYPQLKSYIESIRSPRLKVNHNKTVFSSRKNKRMVTGLILTSQGDVSIGRQKKRYLKRSIHKYMNDQLDQASINYLSGYLAYLSSVEPEFLERLKVIYGSSVLEDLFA